MISMETKASYTLAGLFVLVLTAFIIVAVIWLSSGLSTEEYTFYHVYMTESVSGLNQDGPVEFNGVKVGSVYEMTINRKYPRLVELLIKIKSDTPVTQGTKAKLNMKALSGVAYLLLEDKGTDMRPLVAKPGEKYPVIPTVPSILVRLESTLIQLNENFSKITHSIQALLNKENLENLRKFLFNGQNMMYLLKTQTIPYTNQAVSHVDDMTRDLSDVVREIKENPSVLIRGKQSPPPGPGER